MTSKVTERHHVSLVTEGVWQCQKTDCLEAFTGLAAAIQHHQPSGDVGEMEELKPEAACPKCKLASYVYDLDGYESWIGYCGNCNIDFDVETGDIYLEEEITTVEPKSLPKANDLTHTCNSIREGKALLWKCGGCKFETFNATEATQHEHQNGNFTYNLGGDIKTIGTEEKHYTKVSDKPGGWKCKYCQAEFTNSGDASAHDNEAGKKAEGYVSYSYSPVKLCKHEQAYEDSKTPQHIIDGKEEGWGVWAGRRFDVEDHADEFDIVLNLTGSTIVRRKRHEIPIPELAKWEKVYQPKFKEVLLDWPDRGVVDLPKAFWVDLTKYLKKNKLRMLVFCVGGHGRTGTAIASLFVTALQWTPEEATAWVWESYCDHAIETTGQISYVYSMAGKTYVPPKKEPVVTQSSLPVHYSNYSEPTAQTKLL